jgi:hypothetical protein
VNRPAGIDVSFSKSIEFVIAKTNNKLSFVRSRGNWRKSISPGGQALGAGFVGADVRIRDSYDI